MGNLTALFSNRFQTALPIWCATSPKRSVRTYKPDLHPTPCLPAPCRVLTVVTCKVPLGICNLQDAPVTDPIFGDDAHVAAASGCAGLLPRNETPAHPHPVEARQRVPSNTISVEELPDGSMIVA